MSSILILLVTAVAALSTSGSGAGAVLPGSAAQRSNLPSVTGTRYVGSFVERRGGRLTLAGRPFRFAGANGEFLGLRNYGPIPSIGQASGSERYPTKFEIQDELATLHEMGATVVRSQTIGDTVGCSLCIEPKLGRFNPRAFAAMDLVVAEAHRYGIKLIGEFAGDANAGAAFGPPRPGALKGLEQSTDWYCLWHHISQGGCPTATFEDPRLLADYERHMKAVLDHVNPYTGLAYKNDPIFLGWVDGNNLGLLNPTPLPAFGAWLSKVSADFKSIDHKQLFIDVSTYGGDYLPKADSGGVSPEYGPTPPRSIIDTPNVDVFAQEWYPKDFPALDPDSPAATQMHVNAKAITGDGKTYAVIEYGWDHDNYRTRSLLRRFLAGIATDHNISGDLFWALVAQASGHGWQAIPVNLHCQPTCQGPVDDGNWWAMYYTGRTTASNTAADMAARAQILRGHAYTIDGFAHTPAHEVPPAPVITSARGGRVLFEGSAGAPNYSVQKRVDGHWSIRCDHCTTDSQDGWQDPAHQVGCYRVIAYNLAGIAGQPSKPAGGGCQSARDLPPAHDPAASHWVGSWSSSPVDPGPLSPALPDDAGTGGLTVRDVVHTTLGGETIRVRLSNVFGNATATFQDVRVAISSGDASIVASTSRRLRFAGHTSVSVAKGRQIVSDPVKLLVRAGQDVAVSIYSSRSTGRVTSAGSLVHTNYISKPGDSTAADAGRYPATTPEWYWLGGVDVLSSAPDAGAIVALGDSITAGYDSTPNANQDWVDLLAHRLRHAHPHHELAVLNAGIAGNNLHENTPCYGRSAVNRLTEDALDQTGVRYVIVDEGDNDITHPTEPTTATLYQCLAHRKISAAGMIRLFKLAIRRIRAHHLEAIGVTLSPFGRFQYWSRAIETERQAINHWIRTTHAYDGIIDFDDALRDPAHPSWLNPHYDSGDGLHPNDAGHAAMAAAINLSLFTR